jgi:hypothetical protein
MEPKRAHETCEGLRARGARAPLLPATAAAASSGTRPLPTRPAAPQPVAAALYGRDGRAETPPAGAPAVWSGGRCCAGRLCVVPGTAH